MADTKITALTALTAADPANDVIPIVDVSDTTMAASGTTKKISVNNILSSSPTASGALTVTGLVTAGSATITGDLTVDTSTLKVDSANNRVGIGTATPSVALDVVGASAISGTVSVGTTTPLATGSGRGNVTVNGSTDAILAFGIAGVNSGFVLQDSAGMTLLSSGATYLRCYTNGSERYKIDSTGVATWSNVGGVAGTAMTLNSTGLGVGIAPDATKSTRLSVYQTGDLTDETAPLSVGNTAAGGMRLYAGVNNTNEYVYIGSVKSGTGYRSLILQPNGGNVGIGVTPSAWGVYKGLQVGYASLAGYAGSDTLLGSNVYFDGGAFRYIAAGLASSYRQLAGGHQWSTAVAGANPGDPLTLLPQMTLDASGNLILLSSNTPATLTTNGQLTVNATSNTNLRFSYRGSDGTTRVANITLA